MSFSDRESDAEHSTLRHGVKRVHDEIDHHLADLIAVAEDVRSAGIHVHRRLAPDGWTVVHETFPDCSRPPPAAAGDLVAAACDAQTTVVDS